MADSKQGSTNMMFGLMFTLIAIVALIALILSRSSADSASQTASVENTAPVINSATISLSSQGEAATEVDLTESSTKTVYLWGTATDNNSCKQIDDGTADWEGFFGKDDVIVDISGCLPDNLSCYQDVTADISGCSATTTTQVTYEFSFPIQYYADGTDVGGQYVARHWEGWVQVNDGTTTDVATTTSTFEVNTLSGINASETSLSYGSLGLGATSAAVSVELINTGNNNVLDPYVSMSADWTCDVGTIAVAQTKYDTASGGAYATSLSTTPTAVNMDIAKSTNGTDSSELLYTKLTVPSTGTYGSCTATFVVAGS
jgi:hypothetical protein